jgi:hypothetical protein
MNCCAIYQTDGRVIRFMDSPLPRVTEEQVAAAQLRLALDEKLGRQTPEIVHKIAAMTRSDRDEPENTPAQLRVWDLDVPADPSLVLHELPYKTAEEYRAMIQKAAMETDDAVIVKLLWNYNDEVLRASPAPASAEMMRMVAEIKRQLEILGQEVGIAAMKERRAEIIRVIVGQWKQESESRENPPSFYDALGRSAVVRPPRHHPRCRVLPHAPERSAIE